MQCLVGGGTVRAAGRRGCWWSCGRTIFLGRGNAVGIRSGLLLLCLVANEVNLGLAGLRWRRCGDDNLRLLLWLLDQHIHKGLLLVLWELWNDRGGRCRWRWGLDKDDLVMLLWRRHVQRFPEMAKMQKVTYRAVNQCTICK